MNPFENMSLEQLELIRKSKSSKIERELAYMTMLDKEIEERHLKQNITNVFRALNRSNQK